MAHEAQFLKDRSLLRLRGYVQSNEQNAHVNKKFHLCGLMLEHWASQWRINLSTCPVSPLPPSPRKQHNVVGDIAQVQGFAFIPRTKDCLEWRVGEGRRKEGGREWVVSNGQGSTMRQWYWSRQKGGKNEGRRAATTGSLILSRD